MVTPFYLGNSAFKGKVKSFQKNGQQYNTVVFGSSHSYRQFNPNVFDSLMTDYNLSTYNMATGGTFNPESYYQYEQFLKRLDNNVVKYAFLELKPLKFYDWKNTNTTKGSYWNTTSTLSYALNYINASDYDKTEKIVLTKTYLNSFLNSFIDIGILKGLLFKPSVKGKTGFFPLDKELSSKKRNNEFTTRHTIFLADTTVLQERIAAAKNIPRYYNSKDINSVHLNHLKHLISASKEKGIHLFLLVPPRLKDRDYQEVIPLLNELPNDHSLELANYQENKDFYSAKNSFDIGHLNLNGANLFTKKCAELATEKLQIR
ncbi:MAG: hypothetical protein Mars2KO_09970 [Maribacter sp.]